MMQSETRATTSNPRPKVAVVIGAIGVRAAAAIPLFEFLDEANVEVDLLIGSSSGAIFTAMRGAGVTTAQMREFVEQMRGEKPYSQLDYRTIFGFAHPKLAKPGIGSALKKPHRQQQLFQRVFGTRRLEELKPTTLLQSADCLAGESVVLN